jgi:hypothetical protein
VTLSSLSSKGIKVLANRKRASVSASIKKQLFQPQGSNRRADFAPNGPREGKTGRRYLPPRVWGSVLL